MSVNTKMTAIANEIRTLSNTTGTMGLDAMATNVHSANEEIDSQTELLEQAIIALQGKAAGGESSGLPTGVSALATGTFTPSSDISTAHTITHDLGVKPNFAFLMLCDDAGTTALLSNRLFHAQYYKKVINANGQSYLMRGFIIYMTNAGAITATIVTGSSTAANAATTSSVTFAANTAGLLKAGFTYRWVCGVADDIQ